MSAILQVRGEDGQFIDIPALVGPPGADGTDGVSPTVSVSKSGKITTITIVDAEGTHTATINDGADGSGAGDMVRATYDANENGIVDDAEKLGGQLPSYYAKASDVPSVPAWALSSTKPAYTAQEVGAAAAEHTHEQGDITGLSNALAGKAAAEHTHTQSDVTGLETALAGKVNTESGKGLSANDYTTAEKQKLAGIAAGANNYVHPSTHPASMITGLAIVATSGSYNDLTDKPNIAGEIDVDTTITEGGTNPVTGGAIYTALAGKADAGDIPAGLLQSAFHGTVSLLSTGWTQGDDDWYSQTVTATGVTATAIVYVAFHPDSRSAFLDAGIYCSAQAANQLTFKAASQPESNISVNVHAMEVSA